MLVQKTIILFVTYLCALYKSLGIMYFVLNALLIHYILYLRQVQYWFTLRAFKFLRCYWRTSGIFLLATYIVKKHKIEQMLPLLHFIEYTRKILHTGTIYSLLYKGAVCSTIYLRTINKQLCSWLDMEAGLTTCVSSKTVRLRIKNIQIKWFCLICTRTFKVQ